MIKESSIDLIREADIVTIVQHYCELKRTGSSFTCRSPFTADKTASFNVNPVKNNWVCYSSNQAGDGIKFVMLKENCDFIIAVEKIAGICNIILEHEAVTEAQQKQIDSRKRTLEVVANVANKYAAEFKNLADNHWAKEMITTRKITPESILNFQIGYTPGNRLIAPVLIDKGLFEIAKNTGLISVKDERNFDFFNDRIIFPIQNERGDIIAFGGRAKDGTSPKYLNSKESSIYTKTKALYGLYQAKHAINIDNTAVLMEGYTDVIAAHQNDVVNAVATCGTALTKEQGILLKKYARTVIILRDNDGYDENGNEKAGTKAALKDVNTLLNCGFKTMVCLLPEGEDPDSYTRKGSLAEYIQENVKDAVEWKATNIKNKAANDPDAISDAVMEIAEMLFQIKDDIKRNIYTDNISKLFKIKKTEFTSKLAQIQEAIETKAAQTAKLSNEQLNDLNLPAGADYQEYMSHRFVTVDNTYYFRGKEGFFKGTNFRVTPLFHVYGQKNNKRVCEVENELGIKKLIEFDTEDFVQKTRFETRLLNESFFVFTENFANNHFSLMKNRILSEFFTAYELTTLGWQNKEKFFAFADCIYDNGILKKVNQYGLTELSKDEDEDETNSEYFAKIKHFYSPAFSELYKHSRDDDDPYENDRYFVYKQSPVTFQTWIEQMIKVYGIEKAILGISFIMSTLHRDIFIRRYMFFPHMFCTGEKGSGKSKFAESLVSLFTYKQEPFDLHSGTPVAFYRRLARLNNVPTMLEEFNDNIDEKIFQTLKGSYDGRGREMGKATGDNRTSTTKVNSSLIILSQYMSARDDNSLTSRSLLAHFIKKQDPYTNEEIQEYAKLQSWQEQGLSSMLIELVELRKYVSENIHKEYADINKNLKKDLMGKEYQERMLQNYVAMLAPLKLISSKIHIPFSYEQAYDLFKNAILDSSDLIVESEGLAEFWKVLEYLLERKLIVNGTHFKIDNPLSIKIQGRKGEAPTEWINSNRKRVLYLRLNAVHQLYHKEVSTRDGVDVITESTIRNYFRSKKYYIGMTPGTRFENIATNAMCFDYDMMMAGNIINLDRDIIKEELPF